MSRLETVGDSIVRKDEKGEKHGSSSACPGPREAVSPSILQHSLPRRHVTVGQHLTVGQCLGCRAYQYPLKEMLRLTAGSILKLLLVLTKDSILPFCVGPSASFADITLPCKQSTAYKQKTPDRIFNRELSLGEGVGLGI